MYKYFEYLKPLRLLKFNQFEWGYYNVYLLTSMKQTIIVVQAHDRERLSYFSVRHMSGVGEGS